MSELDVHIQRAGYGRATVLHDISFRVQTGKRFVILGGNGAGKTTTLRAITGGCEAVGEITVDGVPLMGRATNRIAAAGIAHVPQGRGTFGELTVRENLLIGAITRSKRDAMRDADTWMQRFPRLGERASRPAAGLSGGEQQMLAIARAFMSAPSVVLLDEPSLGLSPKLTTDTFDVLDALARETGVSLVIVEQNAELALGIADDGLVIASGRVAAHGTAADLRDDDEVRRAYLGV